MPFCDVCWLAGWMPLPLPWLGRAEPLLDAAGVVEFPAVLACAASRIFERRRSVASIQVIRPLFWSSFMEMFSGGVRETGGRGVFDS